MTSADDEWLASLEIAKDVDVRDATDLRAIGTALNIEAAARESVAEAVDAARRHGRSWTEIANVLGVSRQVARQRFTR